MRRREFIDLMELIDEDAAAEGQTSSEVMRAAISEYMRKLADQDDKIRAIGDGIAQRRIMAQTNATRRKLGMDPIDVDSSPDEF
jgi:hypothetical protein